MANICILAKLLCAFIYCPSGTEVTDDLALLFHSLTPYSPACSFSYISFRVYSFFPFQSISPSTNNLTTRKLFRHVQLI